MPATLRPSHRAPVPGLAVAETLMRLLGADGRLDPSHATLAALTRVEVSTVRRALDQLRSLGLLCWQRRLVRGEGWRAEQTSNAYWLTPGAENPAVCCEAQIARAVKIVSFKKDAREVERVAPEVRHPHKGCWRRSGSAGGWRSGWHRQRAVPNDAG